MEAIDSKNKIHKPSFDAKATATSLIKKKDSTCWFPDCNHESHHSSKGGGSLGLCHRHYEQCSFRLRDSMAAKRKKDSVPSWVMKKFIQKKQLKVCWFPGCDRKIAWNGLCRRDYERCRIRVKNPYLVPHTVWIPTWVMDNFKEIHSATTAISAPPPLEPMRLSPYSFEKLFESITVAEAVIRNLPALCHDVRIERGMNQRELAERLGISKNRMSNFEKGISLSVDTILSVFQWIQED